MIEPLEEVTSIVLSISGAVATQIPEKYLGNAMPYYIDITSYDANNSGTVINDTASNVRAAYQRGRQLVVRVSDTFTGFVYYLSFGTYVNHTDSNGITTVAYAFYGYVYGGSSVLHVALVEGDDNTLIIDNDANA